MKPACFFVIRAWSICPRCTTAYRLIVRPLSPCDCRRSHFRHQTPPRPYDAKDPSSERWNCGQECWLVIFAEMLTSMLHLGIFYMPQICNMGPTALLPLQRKACWGFLRPEKSWRLRPGLNLRTWVLKGSTLPLDHWSRLGLPLLHWDVQESVMHLKIEVLFLTLQTTRRTNGLSKRQTVKCVCLQNFVFLKIPFLKEGYFLD